MNNVIQNNQVESLVITIRGERVLLDSDVATLYGVETREINQAVRNNPDKFPDGYTWELEQDEKTELVEIFDRFNKLKHSTTYPKAFTEKGLYMLAICQNQNWPEFREFTEFTTTFCKFREF
ncbi:MAG: ORF6N domain-containing protein [Fibromonadaceae bacterium]|nr:ORF6N domain-containing protein [Fibromonadaceae bacterium]